MNGREPVRVWLVPRLVCFRLLAVGVGLVLVPIDTMGGGLSR